MSVSENWYVVKDHGTNYCNLYNLMEGETKKFLNVKSCDQKMRNNRETTNCPLYFWPKKIILLRNHGYV